MGVPLNQTLKIYQGQTFRFRFVVTQPDEVTPLDLTGYKARMHIREELPSTTTVLELTTENDRITITPATGLVDLAISAVDTEALELNYDVVTWVYDLEIYDETVSPTYVERIAEGVVVAFPEVTR